MCLQISVTHFPSSVKTFSRCLNFCTKFILILQFWNSNFGLFLRWQPDILSSYNGLSFFLLSFTTLSKSFCNFLFLSVHQHSVICISSDCAKIYPGQSSNSSKGVTLYSFYFKIVKYPLHFIFKTLLFNNCIKTNI